MKFLFESPQASHIDLSAETVFCAVRLNPLSVQRPFLLAKGNMLHKSIICPSFNKTFSGNKSIRKGLWMPGFRRCYLLSSRGQTAPSKAWPFINLFVLNLLPKNSLFIVYIEKVFYVVSKVLFFCHRSTANPFLWELALWERQKKEFSLPTFPIVCIILYI